MAITIKAARVNKGLSQEDAAKALGVSKSTIQSYESGKSFPDIPVIKRMEDLYGIQYANLIFLPEKRA